jgi:protein-L-isoaspartate(D-aspartate) O-methyltransferase
MVTAAAGKLPDALLTQLAPGGRMLVPVGRPGLQTLKLVTKDLDGRVAAEDLEGVRFVELVGPYGWTENQAGCAANTAQPTINV